MKKMMTTQEIQAKGLKTQRKNRKDSSLKTL